jgi:hypothetical protein
LALLFNILCFIFHFPESWRENRTTLIPKPNKDFGKAENWRPITIGPIFGRIFSLILHGRISIVQNVRQKGFNGCKINVELLNAVLVQSKRKKGGVYTILDISKAFDTVPHSAIKPCLTKKGISIPLIELITNIYKNCKAKINTKSGIGVEIKILR